MAALQFPFFKPAEELPASLPTVSDILTSEDIIKGTETWATGKVVGVGEHFIAKYGKSNDAIEGKNLLFLEQNGFQNFVPKLYAMWKETDGTLFLVMERLRGDTLDKLWPTLQDIFTQIRAVPHEEFFGSVDKCHNSRRSVPTYVPTVVDAFN